jgi:uncharacterized protein YdiU (UPF0061 family)
MAFDDSFVQDLPGLYEPWQASPASAPRLLALNRSLAVDLGLDAAWLATPDGVALLVGNHVPEGTTPVAQAYAGHQFGGYSPRLGDGRALLVGELIDVHGARRDLHLKGSGRTPFARGGDGRAAVGPMLREYLISEAMHALGIPTTRALAVVATGDRVVREQLLPGAVLARVAASHLRVGSFEYAARSSDPTLLRRLADHAITRHHPDAAASDQPYVALLERVIETQASLVAQWMLVGFIHGVMNTDNMTISGETIDYGPCAFMDTYDPDTVFSSIDHGGRYAYGNQPQIAHWNLARLAEALLPLFDDDQERAVERATEVLDTFGDRFSAHWRGGMRAKLGFDLAPPDEVELIDDLLGLLHDQQVDLTSFFRALSATVRREEPGARGLFDDAVSFDAWSARYLQALVGSGSAAAASVAAGMDRVNPIYVPRNHLVEPALAAATDGELAPFEELLDVTTHPFRERPGLDRFATPAPPGFAGFQTFCGT